VTKPLDFIVIGAQKSGTTSLFEYLRPHPGLYLPARKEVNFFSPKDRFDQGWDRTVEEDYSDALDPQLWGDVSPGYLIDPGTAARIADLMPDTKIIAILRDPAARAYSHYKMNVGRKRETRSFREAVEDQLAPAALDQARQYASGPLHTSECYVAWGEYGRQLQHYFDRFPRQNIYVTFLDDWEQDYESAYTSLIDFIGARSGPIPPNLGEQYHVSVARPDQVIAKGRRSAANTKARRAVRRALSVLPASMGDRILSSARSADPATAARATAARAEVDRLLHAHYEEDLRLLGELTGSPVPWGADRSS
jgi:Sulfotransferase domain